LAWLALASERVWLLDEPVAALDASAIAVLADLLNAHVRAGGAALVATHVDIAGLSVNTQALVL
jgi:heme exporter protein A